MLKLKKNCLTGININAKKNCLQPKIPSPPPPLDIIGWLGVQIYIYIYFNIYCHVMYIITQISIIKIFLVLVLLVAG